MQPDTYIHTYTHMYLRRPPKHEAHDRSLPTPTPAGSAESSMVRHVQETARAERWTSARVISKTTQKPGLNRSLRPLSRQGQHTYTCMYIFPSHLFSSHYSRAPSQYSNSHPGSRSGRPSSPLSTMVRALSFFITKKTQHFLPSSTRAELCVPTLLGAVSSC